MDDVYKSSSSGPIATQEPAPQYVEAASKASGSSGRAGSTTRGPGRPRKPGPTG